MNQSETALALSDTASILNELKIEYFLVGSFASGIHGEFRATNDIDIVCRLKEEQLDLFLESLKGKFLCDAVALREQLRHKKSFNIIHEPTFVKVDLFFKVSSLEAEEFSRSEKLKIPESDIFISVSTVEYNIIAKLRWYKMSNKQLSRQLEDVRSMLSVAKDDTDRDYLERWSKSEGVYELLADLCDF